MGAPELVLLVVVEVAFVVLLNDEVVGPGYEWWALIIAGSVRPGGCGPSTLRSFTSLALNIMIS